jgi:hypothetical protein
MALVLVKSPEGCHTQGGETPLPALISLADQATEYAKASKASETRRGYASDLKRFAAFCEALGVEMLPASPPTVALYLTHLAQAHAVATIRRHMVAIAQAHKNAGLPSPVADPHVRSILQGITRTKGTKQRKKTALTGDLLKDAVSSLDPVTLQGKRDRAILLLGFALAGGVIPNRRNFRHARFSAATRASRSMSCPPSRTHREYNRSINVLLKRPEGRH